MKREVAMGRIQSTYAWLGRYRPDILVWLIVAVTSVLAYLSYVRNLGLFYYDSRYYMAFSFWFSGDTQQVARDRTAEFASMYNIPMPDAATTFGWGLVQPRVVLPFLSAPFMNLFGPYGLAVIPAVATIVFTILLTIVMKRRYGNVAAVATVVLMNASLRIVVLTTGMLTESLSAVWSLVALMLTWRYIRTRRWWLLVLIGLVTLLSGFTRQATLIMAGAFAMAWLLGMLVSRRWRSPWMWPAIVVGATTVITQVVQTLVWPFSQTDQFLRITGSSTLTEALSHVPGLAKLLLFTDLKTFMATDKPLLFILFLSVAGMVIFWRRAESHLLFGAILAIAVYNITNGTATGFRYAIPGLAFFMLSVALVLAATAKRLRSPEDSAAGIGEDAVQSPDPWAPEPATESAEPRSPQTRAQTLSGDSAQAPTLRDTV
jgi:hypothetical protein